MMNQDFEALKQLLEGPLDYPEVLDDLWAAYLDTRDTAFVVKIISVLDWEDRTRKHLGRQEFSEQFAEWTFPIDCEKQTMGGPLDMDLHVALLAKYGQLKFDELPVQLPAADLVHLSMKSAALSSLMSIAAEDAAVAEVCVSESQTDGGPGRALLAHASAK